MPDAVFCQGFKEDKFGKMAARLRVNNALEKETNDLVKNVQATLRAEVDELSNVLIKKPVYSKFITVKFPKKGVKVYSQISDDAPTMVDDVDEINKLIFIEGGNADIAQAVFDVNVWTRVDSPPGAGVYYTLKSVKVGKK